jgi:hypothetical protein
MKMTNKHYIIKTQNSVISGLIIWTFLSISVTESNAQKTIFSDSIKWENNMTYQNPDGKSGEMFIFFGATNRPEDMLPVYFSCKPINYKVKINDINIINAEYEDEIPSNISKLNDLDKLETSPEIRAYQRIIKKQANICFELVPLRKNPLNGNIERLIYFEVEIDYDKDLTMKSSKSWPSNSILASGNWYKVKVSDEGMYKITHSQLTEMGFASFNNIGVFGYGGIVPLEAGENIYTDLPERPVLKVDANNDGVFNSGDYILFYADGPHNTYFNNSGNFSHDYNTYSDYAYYYISDRGTWKQTLLVSSLGSFNQNVDKYDDYLFLDKDSISLLKSGRKWYWKHFDYFLNHSFTKNIPNLAINDTAIIKIPLAARSSSASSFSIQINNQQQNNVNIASTSSSTSAPYVKVNSNNNTFYVVPGSSTLDFNITYTKTSTDSQGWLEYISMTVRRNLRLNNNYVKFRDTRSLADGNIARFNIQNATNSTIVWDITDRTNYKKINGILDNSVYRFNADASELKEYVAFNPVSNFPTPDYQNAEDIGPVQNQNLHALQPKDIIIITHPLFKSQAEQVASLHQTHENFTSIIVSPDEIYNEFSSGSPDISAIRNFLKMLYDKSNPEDIPRNVILFGDGSYNNKSDLPSVSNYIPTYQTLESISPANSYVSDDFYVLLDDGEGSFLSAEGLDMGISRITVKSVDEAQTFVEKLSTYYNNQSFGNWKNILTFIADDFDGGETMHQNQSESLTQYLDVYHTVYNIDKIYMDDYQQIATAQGQAYPDVNQALNDRIANGTLLINWIGHGNEKGWGHESILTLSMIQNWNNSSKLPIFVTATCEFTPWDHHEIVSGGEMVLLNPNGGGIALITTTRLAFASSNFAYLQKLYDVFFTKDSENKALTMGEIVAISKNNLPTNNFKRVFSLLGSAAMRPAVPYYEVRTTKINGINVNEFNDTISSQSLVNFEGAVFDHNGNIMTDFSGVVNPTVYDKRLTYTTQANDGIGPLDYTAQRNILFNGQASVTNGQFSFSFVVPVDITYIYNQGKVSYYAHDRFDNEAHGYDNSFVIGGSSDNPVSAQNPPEIELFMNNEQFVNGGITDENPVLLANLYSEVGINTVGSGIGHDITMVLNENTNQSIILNKFYESELDDFTSGKIRYQLSELPLGPHTLSLKAWDVLNNSAEAITDFIVASSSELIIDHIFNYPNPFSTNTDFYFDHNQPNTQLDVLIQIFTVSGKHINTVDAIVMTDGFRSQPINWNARDEYGDKLGKGVYIYKVKVKEPGGNIVEKFEKLVILN